MYTLVIVPDVTSGNHWVDEWVTLWPSESEAENVGAYWLDTNPKDVVMVVEVAVDVCEHCRKTIHEKPCWVFHRWVHMDTKAYTCILPGLPQATPKEKK